MNIKCPDCGTEEVEWALTWACDYIDTVLPPILTELSQKVKESININHTSQHTLYICGNCESYYSELDINITQH